MNTFDPILCGLSHKMLLQQRFNFLTMGHAALQELELNQEL